MGCAAQGEKAAVIQELRQEGHPLKYLLKFSGLAKSTYYYELKRTDRIEERNKSITETICHIFEKISRDMVFGAFVTSWGTAASISITNGAAYHA